MSNKLPELFKRFEDELQQEILGNEDPFLGLFAERLGPKTKEMIVDRLQECSNPLESLIDNLFFYPALISTLVVDRLLNDVGKNGYFEVYPILEEMIGAPIQLAKYRNELWQNFRRACLRLGLQVSARTAGTHFMVDDYLRQAGLPIVYVQGFTEKAVGYANEIGVPEEDDHESLAVWQRGLVERLKNPFPLIAKKAIIRDQASFYSSVFVRLFHNLPEDLTRLSFLERAMAESLKSGAQSRKAGKLIIPEIVIRDLEYGVLLPSSTSVEDRWVVNTDGNENYYSTRGEDLFVPFDVGLAKSVAVTRNGTKWSTDLWEDTKNNRLLIFSLPTGRLVQGACLADTEVFLDPGDYAILLRFKPTDEEHLEMFSESPDLYLRKVSVLPGSELAIQRGPAKVSVKGIDMPTLTWNQNPLRGVKGNEVYPANNLAIKAYIPDEYSNTSREYTLTVKESPLGESIDVHFTATESGEFEIDLHSHLSSWKPGVTRASVSLHNRGSLKKLARKSAIIWNGLVDVNKRVVFHCSNLPTNLDEASCINVNVATDRNVLTFKDDTNRFFKFAFRDGNITRYFTWAVPGIFINLMTYHENGFEERSLPVGSVLPVSKTSRKNIKVFASFPATLKIGDYEVDVDFSRIGSKTVPLGSLLEYSNSNHNALLLKNKEDGTAIPLVELVTPSTVEEYTAQTENGLRQACFKTLEEIDGLRVTAKNMVDGATHTVEFEYNLDQKIGAVELVPGVNISTQVLDDNEVFCCFPVKNWPYGFWIIAYHLKVNSRWGVAMNKNSEEIADSVLFCPVEYATKPNEVLEVFCKTSTCEEKVEVLLSIHNVMMSRFAEECWPQVSWLRSFWSTLCFRYVRFAEDSALWGKLLRCAATWPEEAIAEGHVTTSILSGYLLNMFCFERSYVPVKGQISSSLLSCMAAFPSLDDLSEALKNQIIDTSVLFGFENAAQVCTSCDKPKGFSMERYHEALQNYKREEGDSRLLDDLWIPAKGDFLGSLHYRYSLNQLHYRYLRSLSVISERRGRVLGIVRKMSCRDLSKYVTDSRFAKFTKNIDLGMFFDVSGEEEFLSEQEAVTREHLTNMVRFVALVAQVCRADLRAPGILRRFLNDIQQTCGMSNSHVSGYLGYLLFLAEDIFAFYLMLWEVVFTADIDGVEEKTAIEGWKRKKRKRIYVRD